MTSDIEKLTAERSAIYGHPLDVYTRQDLIIRAVRDCKDIQVRVALEMIAMKMVRLVESPDHLDSAVDIGGYAHTIVMVHRERARRKRLKRHV